MKANDENLRFLPFLRAKLNIGSYLWIGQLSENMLQHFASSFKLVKLELFYHICVLKTLVKTQNVHILQYSDWYWLLLSINMIHQLLRTVLYTIPRKARFTKRCFQKISGELHRISLEKLLTKAFHFYFLAFTFL